MDFKRRSSMFTWTWIISGWWVSYSSRDLLFQPIAALIWHLSCQRRRRRGCIAGVPWLITPHGTSKENLRSHEWTKLFYWSGKFLWKITANSLDECCLVCVIKGWNKYSLFGSESKIKRMLSLSYAYTCTVSLWTKA